MYVVSEEKDSVPSEEVTSSASPHNQEVDENIHGDDDVISVGDITVWIDPLDATQVCRNIEIEIGLLVFDLNISVFF